MKYFLLIFLSLGCIDNPLRGNITDDTGTDVSDLSSTSDGSGTLIGYTDAIESDVEPQLDIAERLAALESVVEVSEEDALDGFRRFNVVFEQHIDHDDLSSPTFLQRVRLYHKDETAPMVMTTGGYGLATFERENLRGVAGTWEVTDYIEGANQISVGNRFYFGAFPTGEAQDWTLYSIERVLADHHRIVALLKPVYTSVWIRNGFSQGGVETLAHEWKYPDDFDLVVGESPPIMLGISDDRNLEHLATIGTESCRNRLKELTFAIFSAKKISKNGI